MTSNGMLPFEPVDASRPRQPGGLRGEDPWLCVPASRRVCPGRWPRWRIPVVLGPNVGLSGTGGWPTGTSRVLPLGGGSRGAPGASYAGTGSPVAPRAERIASTITARCRRDQQVADAEHVGERQPAWDREDVGEEPQGGIGHDGAVRVAASMAAPGPPISAIAARPAAWTRRWRGSRRGCTPHPRRRAACPARASSAGRRPRRAASTRRRARGRARLRAPRRVERTGRPGRAARRRSRPASGTGGGQARRRPPSSSPMPSPMTTA